MKKKVNFPTGISVVLSLIKCQRDIQGITHMTLQDCDGNEFELSYDEVVELRRLLTLHPSPAA